jgi:hypothetical protein
MNREEKSKGFVIAVNDLVPYIQELYNCTSTDAKLMIKLVFASMTKKLIEDKSVRTPFGRIQLAIKPRYKMPLKFILKEEPLTTARINGYETERITMLDALVTPKHALMLAELQAESREAKEKYDKIREDRRRELQDNSTS